MPYLQQRFQEMECRAVTKEEEIKTMASRCALLQIDIEQLRHQSNFTKQHVCKRLSTL